MKNNRSNNQLRKEWYKIHSKTDYRGDPLLASEKKHKRKMSKTMNINKIRKEVRKSENMRKNMENQKKSKGNRTFSELVKIYKKLNKERIHVLKSKKKKKRKNKLSLFLSSNTSNIDIRYLYNTKPKLEKEVIRLELLKQKYEL